MARVGRARPPGGDDAREAQAQRRGARERVRRIASGSRPRPSGLLTSEGWQRWARVRAQGGLARLSLSNQLLVALARPHATFVAGSSAVEARLLRAQGREGDPIVAPMPIKDHDADGDDEAQTRVLFKGVSVFDASRWRPLTGPNRRRWSRRASR